MDVAWLPLAFEGYRREPVGGIGSGLVLFAEVSDLSFTEAPDFRFAEVSDRGGDGGGQRPGRTAAVRDLAEAAVGDLAELATKPNSWQHDLLIRPRDIKECPIQLMDEINDFRHTFSALSLSPVAGR